MTGGTYKKKRIAFLAIAAVIFLCGIAAAVILEMDRDYAFKETKDGKIISRENGTEYNFLAHEGWIVCLGDYEHIGRIKNENEYYYHFGLMQVSTGMYRLTNDDKENILLRHYPYGEWRDIYRNAALPELDLSIDNLERIEWINCLRYHCDASHATCGYGLTGDKMHDFFKEVYSGQTADEAKLVDLVRKPDGFLENCYVAATIFGYFEDEPNIALAMEILSYNDKAYTIELPYEDYYEEFVIPDNWLEELVRNAHIVESEGGSVQIISKGGFDVEE